MKVPRIATDIEVIVIGDSDVFKVTSINRKEGTFQANSFDPILHKFKDKVTQPLSIEGEYYPAFTLKNFMTGINQWDSDYRMGSERAFEEGKDFEIALKEFAKKLPEADKLVLKKIHEILN